MTRDLSIVIPICDRTALLEETLKMYGVQTAAPSRYEFVIVDDGGTDDTLLPMLAWARSEYSLNVRYYRIDISVLPFEIYQYDGRLNDPGPALNVGIKKARAPRVVLTSPEIKPLQNSCVQSLLDWDLPAKHGLICDVWDPDLSMWIGGGPSGRALHFLAMFHRQDLIDTGGFDERFIGGWGFQDCEFSDRWTQYWGGKFVFSGPAIKAWHQSHPRVEFIVNDGGVAKASAIYKVLFGQSIANQNHPWGSDNLIVGEKWND